MHRKAATRWSREMSADATILGAIYPPASARECFNVTSPPYSSGNYTASSGVFPRAPSLHALFSRESIPGKRCFYVWDP